MSNPANGWNAWKRSIAIPSLSSVGASVTVSVRAIDGYGRYSSIAKVSSLADSSIAMARSSYTTAYKGTATITGRLTSGASGLASKKVTVSPSSGGVSTVWTNSTGYFSFKAAPSSKSTYTFTYAGDNGYGASSAKATVTPHAKVTTPVVPSYVKHTKSFRAYTYLYPKHTAGTTAMTFYFQKREQQRQVLHGEEGYGQGRDVLIGEVEAHQPAREAEGGQVPRHGSACGRRPCLDRQRTEVLHRPLALSRVTIEPPRAVGGFRARPKRVR